MVLLIDTNIILDVLMNRKDYKEESSLVWKMCETKMAKGYISSLSFCNLIYVLRKELTPEAIELTLNSLKLIFDITELNYFDLYRASKLRWSDYEDAIQATIAERSHADYIVTRNVKDFESSNVIALTPSELLTRLND